MDCESGFKYVKTYYSNEGKEFCLRPSTSSDLDLIVKNINTVCDEKYVLHTNEFILTSEWQYVLKNSVDVKKGDLLIVAESNKNVVGHLRLFPEWYGQKGRHVGIIGIVILEPWRKMGIGSAMMRYAIEWSKLAKFEKLTASVISSNRGAINLFKKFNFIIEGVRRKQFLIDQTYFDEFLMGRFILKNDHDCAQ